MRLRRLGHLLQALQGRLLTQTQQAPDGAQLTYLLGQIAGLLPGLQQTLRASMGPGGRAPRRSRSSCSTSRTWTLRPLAAALNFHWRPDPALLRFVARSSVVQLIGVALFMHFGLERGYWLP